ncbi:hypothetical protein AB6G46_24100 [Providencia hangzhouensis]
MKAETTLIGEKITQGVSPLITQTSLTTVAIPVFPAMTHNQVKQFGLIIS